MKKLLFILLALVVSICQQSHAYTAKDLVGKQCNVRVHGTLFEMEKNYMDAYSSEVVAGTSSNQIILKNFLNQGFDLPVTVSGNALSITPGVIYNKADGGNIRIGSRNFNQNGYLYEPSHKYHMMPCQWYGYNLSKSIESDALTNVNGEIKASFENKIGFNAWTDLLSYRAKDFDYGFFFFGRSAAGTPEYRQFGQFDFAFADYNNTVTETADNGTTKKYAVNTELVATDTPGKYYVLIDNLFSRGKAYQNIFKFNYTADDVLETVLEQDVLEKSLIATIKPDGTVIVDNSGTYGAESGFAVSGNTVIGGANDRVVYENELTVAGFVTHSTKSPSGTLTSNRSFGFWEIFNPNFYTWDVVFAANSNEDYVTGTWEPVSGTVAHSSNNRWSTRHGGDLSTKVSFDGIKVHLGPCGIFDEMKDEMVASAKSLDFTLNTSDVIDHTHDLDLDIDYCYYTPEDKNTHLSYKISNRVNNNHVKSYDLMLAPGSHTDISTMTLHSATGHADAIILDSGIAPANSADGSINAEFAGKVSAIADNADMLDKDHTFFIRTNYTPESGLEPSFHALTTSLVQTGIDTVEADADAPVEYYNTQGMRIGKPAAGGVYLRRQGSKVTKVQL